MASSQDAKRALTVFLYFQESILTPLARPWWTFINHVSSRGIAISVFKLQRFPGISSAGKDWFHGSSREGAPLPQPLLELLCEFRGQGEHCGVEWEDKQVRTGEKLCFLPLPPFSPSSHL